MLIAPEMVATKSFEAKGPMTLAEAGRLLVAAAVLMEERTGRAIPDGAYAWITSKDGGTCGFGLIAADAGLCAAGAAVARLVGPSGTFLSDGERMPAGLSVELAPTVASASVRAAHRAAARASSDRIEQVIAEAAEGAGGR